MLLSSSVSPAGIVVSEITTLRATEPFWLLFTISLYSTSSPTRNSYPSRPSLASSSPPEAYLLTTCLSIDRAAVLIYASASSDFSIPFVADTVPTFTPSAPFPASSASHVKRITTSLPAGRLLILSSQPLPTCVSSFVMSLFTVSFHRDSSTSFDLSGVPATWSSKLSGIPVTVISSAGVGSCLSGFVTSGRSTSSVPSVSPVLSWSPFSSGRSRSTSSDVSVSSSSRSIPAFARISSSVIDCSSTDSFSRAASCSSTSASTELAASAVCTSTESKSSLNPAGMSLSVITTLRATVLPAAPILAFSSSSRPAYFSSSARSSVPSSFTFLTVISNGTWSPTCHSYASDVLSISK